MKAKANTAINVATAMTAISIVSVGNGLVWVGLGVEVGVEVGVGVDVGLELGAGVGVPVGAVVVIVSIPEAPHKFKELLAYSRKPTTAPTVLFNAKVTLPQLGFEVKAAQDAFTHCPVLFVLKMYPPPDKL